MFEIGEIKNLKKLFDDDNEPTSLTMHSYYAKNRKSYLQEHMNELPKKILLSMLYVVHIVPYFIITKLLTKEKYTNYIESDEFKVDTDDIKDCYYYVLKLFNITNNNKPPSIIDYMLIVLIKYIRNNEDVQRQIKVFQDIDKLTHIKQLYERLSNSAVPIFWLCFYDFYVYSFISEKKEKECNFYCILSGDAHTRIMDKVFTEVYGYTRIQDNPSILKQTSIVDTLKNYNIIDRDYKGPYDNIISILKMYNNYKLNTHNIETKMWINTLSNDALPSKNGLIYQFFQNDSKINPFVSEVPIFNDNLYKKIIKLLFNYDLDSVENAYDNQQKIEEVLYIIKKYNKYKYDKCILHENKHEKCITPTKEYYTNEILFTYLTKCPLCTIFDDNTKLITELSDDDNQSADLHIEDIHSNPIYMRVYQNVFEKIDDLKANEDEDKSEIDTDKNTLKNKTLLLLIELNEDRYLDIKKYEDITTDYYYKKLLSFITYLSYKVSNIEEINQELKEENINKVIKENLENQRTINNGVRGCSIMGGNVNEFIIHIQSIVVFIIICLIVVLIYYIVKEHNTYKKYKLKNSMNHVPRIPKQNIQT